MIGFEALQQKLLETLRARVHRGEWTERGLARTCGISQPHLHNVLKGQRLLSGEAADKVMRALQISIPDISGSEISPADPELRLVPLLIPEIGPNCGAYPRHNGEYFSVARDLFNEFTDLAAVKCGYDPEMSPAFRPGDTLLIACGVDARDHSTPGGSYLVHTRQAYLIRYVRPEGCRLLLLSERTAGDPRQWEEIDLAGVAVREVVQARVISLTRLLR